MNIGYIGALVVMVALTAFAFLLLKVSAADTGNKIRDNVIKQLQSYDSLIQKKSYELAAVQKQIEEAKANLPKRAFSEKKRSGGTSDFLLPDQVDYCNPDFFRDYRRIKEGILFKREEVLRDICNTRQDSMVLEKDRMRSRNLLLDSLMEKFSFENVYRISVLHPEEQLEIAGEMLLEEERLLFGEFVEQNATFSCVAFYQWLYMQKKLCDDVIRVKAWYVTELPQMPGETVRMEYDENVCEGFQIVLGDRMYDYGIRKYELI